MKKVVFLLVIIFLVGCQSSLNRYATGDIAVIIGRKTGELTLINTTKKEELARLSGLGDLSHASVVFSRDERYAYIFGRDGGLTKVDLLNRKIEKRIIQSGNSIGGAISNDGSIIAVANYAPGGVNFFNSDTLELVKRLDTTPFIDNRGEKSFSKTVGLVDSADGGFLVSLWDTNEIWKVGKNYQVTRYESVGNKPYDALLSPNGRYYIAGLFGEDGLAKLDLWQPEKGVEKILDNYGRGNKKLPVYKMPHLEGWAATSSAFYVPAVGEHAVLKFNTDKWLLDKKIKTHGQPIFVMSSPTERYIWVNFAHPLNDKLQVIDTLTDTVIDTIDAGKAVLHMEFTPRGEEVWVSIRDENRVDVYDTSCRCVIESFQVESPSGIFMTYRAHALGL